MPASQSHRFLTNALVANAKEAPNRPALWADDAIQGPPKGNWITWADLTAWIDRLAGLLQESVAETRFCHRVANRVEDVAVALASPPADRIEIPIDAGGGDGFLRHCVDTSGGVFLDDAEKLDLVRLAWKERQHSSRLRCLQSLEHRKPQTAALVLWTSGTSGDPKGVVLTHAGLLANARAKLAAVPQRKSDRRLTVLSIAHAYARTCDLGTWLLSGSALAIGTGFDAWSSLANQVQPTLCNTVPSLCSRLIGDTQGTRDLRLLGCGGAALAEDDFLCWRDRGVIIIQGYGLTEAGPVICSQTPTDSIPGHVGSFVDGWQHTIKDSRLFVRGDHLMAGYLDDPKLTASRYDELGWFDTGDLVQVNDHHQQLRVLGRSDDRIVLANGHIVDPLPIETAVASHRSVRTAFVRKSSDGRSIELWAESHSGISISNKLLQQIVSERLAKAPRWHWPKQIRTISIPAAVRLDVFNPKGGLRRRQMNQFVSGLLEET